MPWAKIVNWPEWAASAESKVIYKRGVYNICLRVPRVAYTTSCSSLLCSLRFTWSIMVHSTSMFFGVAVLWMMLSFLFFFFSFLPLFFFFFECHSCHVAEGLPDDGPVLESLGWWWVWWIFGPWVGVLNCSCPHWMCGQMLSALLLYPECSHCRWLCVS